MRTSPSCEDLVSETIRVSISVPRAPAGFLVKFRSLIELHADKPMTLRLIWRPSLAVIVVVHKPVLSKSRFHVTVAGGQSRKDSVIQGASLRAVDDIDGA